MNGEPPRTRLEGRRYDIDWLRILATFVLFPFHTGKVFDVPPYFPIKNGQLSPGMELLTGFIHFWHMPLFFLLAGWALHASLRARGVGEFLRQRFTKLFIPFALGTATLGPFMMYIQLKVLGPKGWNESFWTFLPTFFTRLDRFNWQHLWFLLYLFTFTLLYLPLFLRLGRAEAHDAGTVGSTALPAGQRPLHPAVAYLPLIPLALAQVLLRSRWPGYQNLIDDWANFVYYSLYLIFGFLLAARPALERTVHSEWKRAGVIGLTAATVLAGPTISYAVEWILATTAGYCLCLCLLGAGRRYLNFTGPAHRYLAEGAFPIYLLHQPVIVGLGYYVIRLPLGIPLKYVLLLAGSLAITLFIYHFLVRPVGFLRFACGMKAKAGPVTG